MNVNLTSFGQVIVALVVGLPITVAACGYYFYRKSRQNSGGAIEQNPRGEYMAALLKWVGGIWAVIGVGNLVGMPWATTGQGLLTAGLMFNMLLFIFPGLIICGVGSIIKSKQAPAAAPVEPKKSVESRLEELATLKEKGFVSAEEFEALRKQLLKEV